MTVNRRRFCQVAATAAAAVVDALYSGASPQTSNVRESRRYFGGFRVGLQSGSYGRLPLGEVIVRAKAAAIKYFELAPAQADFGVLSTVDVRDAKARLLDAGLSTHTYGVVSLRTGEERKRARTLFRRAGEFGLPTLVVECDPDFLGELDELADRFRIEVAVHNGAPGGSAGGLIAPETILKALDRRSPRCGVAVDVGNLLAAGMDPAEAIRSLKGRIFDVHLNDSSQAGVSCVLGEGRADVPGVLEALRRQAYDRVVIVEWKGAAEQAGAAMAASLSYLRKIAGGK